MPALYHALTIADWHLATTSGEVRPGSLETQGYVHLSTRAQAARVLPAVFGDDLNVVVLELEESALGTQLRWEPADPAVGAHESLTESFPHLYRALRVEEVVRVWLRSAFDEGIDLP
jgi:uncharacterized protein (DUF952 family)